MLSRFLRFTENIKKDDQVTLIINCDRDFINYAKFVECDCKTAPIHINMKTEYKSFKYYQVCICCDKQYKYFISKINAICKNLYIYHPCISPEILHLLNDQVWNNIQMSHPKSAFNPNILECLPRAKRLIWKEYTHSATLKYGFYIMQHCKDTDFVTYHVRKFTEFKKDLSSIGIQVQDIVSIGDCDVFIFRDTIEIYTQAISDKIYGYNSETEELVNLTLAFSVPYHYEDLAL